MAVLDSLRRDHVKFDPENVHHKEAYKLLRERGQQHPTLRFILEEGYGSQMSMMQDKLANHLVGLNFSQTKQNSNVKPISAAIRV
jgi:hypothetical protein